MIASDASGECSPAQQRLLLLGDFESAFDNNDPVPDFGPDGHEILLLSGIAPPEMFRLDETDILQEVGVIVVKAALLGTPIAYTMGLYDKVEEKTIVRKNYRMGDLSGLDTWTADEDAFMSRVLTSTEFRRSRAELLVAQNAKILAARGVGSESLLRMHVGLEGLLEQSAPPDPRA